MFTIEQIMSAHTKVKSGAEFPNYIQDLKKLGVTFYETHVSDGYTNYFGKDYYTIASTPKYEQIIIADETDIKQFQADLKAHQLGKTNYHTFCKDAATSGVEKWVVCMDKMTCTYYDRAGKEMLVEIVPTP